MRATMHDLFGVWGDAPLLICVGALKGLAATFQDVWFNVLLFLLVCMCIRCSGWYQVARVKEVKNVRQQVSTKIIPCVCL